MNAYDDGSNRDNNEEEEDNDDSGGYDERFEQWLYYNGTPIEGNGKNWLWTIGNVLTVRNASIADHTAIYLCQSNRGVRAYHLQVG